MAATNYLVVDNSTNKVLANLIISMHDNIANLFALAQLLNETLGQVDADGNLQTAIGANTADNATAIKSLVSTINANLNDPGNGFLQFESRINRP
jgi:hypothetical protein